MERTSLTKALTQKDLERILRVSPMTIYLWRKREKDPFPCRTIPTEGGRHRNLFLLDEIREWIAKHRPNHLVKLNGVQNDSQNRNGKSSGDLLTLFEGTAA